MNLILFIYKIFLHITNAYVLK